MLSHLPAPLRGALAGLTVGLNTVIVFSAMVPAAIVKRLIPATRVRAACDHLLNALASRWVGINNAWIVAVRPDAAWDVAGLDGLRPRGWYLVSCNHQTWVDILVLQRIFHRRIPFLKFFLKAELIWVPVIGLAWWALDFPFMQRGKGGRGSDLKTTRAACQKFKQIPTSVINFVEGTRFTPAKHAAQNSPYRHLLKPKIGGVGVALATMGEQFDALLDVTIAYPHGTPTFWDLLCGRVREVVVRAQLRPIPPALLDAAAQASPRFRAHVQRWIDAMWQDKDRLLDELAAARPVTGSG